MIDKQKTLRSKIFKLVSQYQKNYCSKSKFVPGKTFIPASAKVFDDQELLMATGAVLDCWWTEGKVIEEFVRRFNDFLEMKYAVVVNSGSSANLLALITLMSSKLREQRINKGDEVITVATAFPTTVNPIIQSGCVPVFCDIDVQTLNINTEQMKRAISRKTKAIFLAHMLGNPFNVAAVKNICRRYKLWLIEDCCDALGAKYKGQYVGTFGDLSTFSFYPAHHITMGEGGAVCTNDSLLYKIARSFRDWGRDCWCNTGTDNSCKKRFNWKLGGLPYGYDHKYIYSEIGYNLKNTDLNVAIGLAQMDKLSKFIKKRKHNFDYLYTRLKRLRKFILLAKKTSCSEPSWFGFPIFVRKDAAFSRNDLIRYLESKQIGTRLLFSGNLIRQPAYKDLKFRIISQLNNSDFIMEQALWIGVHPGLDEKMLSYIVSAISNFCDNSEPKQSLKLYNQGSES